MSEICQYINNFMYFIFKITVYYKFMCGYNVILHATHKAKQKEFSHIISS